MENNNQTKQLILNVSKNLFFQNGYSKTTVRNIAENGGILHSNIYYYFKNKREIAKQIYENFHELLISIISINYDTKSIYFLAIQIMITYKYFALDKRFFTLYKEFSKERIIEECLYDRAIRNYKKYSDYYYLNISKKELETIFYITFSTEERFLDMINNNNSLISMRELEEKQIRLPLILMGVDESSIQKIVETSSIEANKFNLDNLDSVYKLFWKK